MKIAINQIPQDGLGFNEEIDQAQFDLETELIKFRSPLKLKGRAYLATNALIVELKISVLVFANCSRCLDEFEWEINKETVLSYPLTSSDVSVDLTDGIREEIILDYPIKPLCEINCQGLCLKCGKNKNQGGCNCGST